MVGTVWRERKRELASRHKFILFLPRSLPRFPVTRKHRCCFCCCWVVRSDRSSVGRHAAVLVHHLYGPHHATHHWCVLCTGEDASPSEGGGSVSRRHRQWVSCPLLRPCALCCLAFGCRSPPAEACPPPTRCMLARMGMAAHRSLATATRCGHDYCTTMTCTHDCRHYHWAPRQSDTLHHQD
jgi:hypothetical protein